MERHANHELSPMACPHAVDDVDLFGPGAAEHWYESYAILHESAPVVRLPGQGLTAERDAYILTKYADIARVVRDCGIRKHVSIHSLRHSYATHLIEAGLNLRGVQEQLGHASPDTTSRYVRMTELVTQNNRDAVNQLVGPLAPLFDAPSSPAQAA